MGTKITGTNTAAYPGITGDDTDTGLFYGTNEIGFSTSGTERVRIAASGQIGIAGANYGSAGQVLTSGGSGGAVSWSTPTDNNTIYDDTNIRKDIAKLALQIAVDTNRAAYNLTNTFIDQFESDSGIGTETNCDRRTGEYVDTVTAGAFSDGSFSDIVSDNWNVGSLTGFSFSNGNADRSNVNQDSSAITVGSTTPLTFAADQPFEVTATNDNVTYGAIMGFYSASVQPSSPSPANNSDWYYSAYHSANTGKSAKAITLQMGSHHNYGDIKGGNADGTGAIVYINSNGNANFAGTQWTFTRDVEGIMRIYQGTRASGTEIFNSDTTGSHGIKNTTEMGIAFGNVGGHAAGMSNLQYRKGTAASANATATLIGTANTASSARTKVSGVFLYKNEAGTATVGTDIEIYFTCNGGTNWTEAASYTAGSDFSSGIKTVYLGETTCTSGTDVRYKAVWANQSKGSKETQLHGIGVNY